MKYGLAGTPTREEWLANPANVPMDGRVGIDPRLISVAAARTLREALATKGRQLVAEPVNLIDLVWPDRPPRPSLPIQIQPIEYTGRTPADKFALLRETLAKRNADGIVVAALDEVAWLFDLRGADIPFNPVFFAYGKTGG